MLGEMADYLEGSVSETRCPDHAAWGAECRRWAGMWGRVVALQDSGVPAGDIETTEAFLTHPAWASVMINMACGQVAAAIVMMTAGIAEFFMGEVRRFAAVKAS